MSRKGWFFCLREKQKSYFLPWFDPEAVSAAAATETLSAAEGSFCSSGRVRFAVPRLTSPSTYVALTTLSSVTRSSVGLGSAGVCDGSCTLSSEDSLSLTLSLALGLTVFDSCWK